MSLKPDTNPSPSPSPLLVSGKAYRRRTIIQILTDYADQFGPTNLASERGGGIQTGHTAMSSEQIDRIESDDPYAKSHRAVATALEAMRVNSYDSYSVLKRTFLGADSGHSEIAETLIRLEDHFKNRNLLLDEVRRRMENGMSQKNAMTYYLNHLTQEMRFASSYELALDELDTRLKGVALYAAFPKDPTPIPDEKTTRRIITEDNYSEICKHFDNHCKNLIECNPEGKRYRNKAMNLTVDSMGVSKPTVERAVRWRDSQSGSEGV